MRMGYSLISMSYTRLDSTGGTKLKNAHSPSRTLMKIDLDVRDVGGFGQPWYQIQIFTELFLQTFSLLASMVRGCYID